MKILLLGKNGQVGWELQRSLSPLGEVIAPDRRSAEFCGDLADLEGLEKTVFRVRPDVIVNAAAYTAVDQAESDAAAASIVNAKAPGVLARAAEASGAWLMHYSTDYVFDGSGSKAWEETDPTGPLSVYGRTKLEGEERIRDACGKHLILRTSWVYAARGVNFARTMLRLARERNRLTVVNDQFGAPTSAELIADVTAHMARTVIASTHSAAGTYHLAAGGETSWHGYARFVVDNALSAGAGFQTLPEDIVPVPSAAFPTAAMRPKNSRLNTSKLRAVFGLELPFWEQGVVRMLAETTQTKDDQT